MQPLLRLGDPKPDDFSLMTREKATKVINSSMHHAFRLLDTHYSQNSSNKNLQINKIYGEATKKMNEIQNDLIASLGSLDSFEEEEGKLKLLQVEFQKAQKKLKQKQVQLKLDKKLLKTRIKDPYGENVTDLQEEILKTKDEIKALKGQIKALNKSIKLMTVNIKINKDSIQKDLAKSKKKLELCNKDLKKHELLLEKNKLKLQKLQKKPKSNSNQIKKCKKEIIASEKTIVLLNKLSASFTFQVENPYLFIGKTRLSLLGSNIKKAKKAAVTLIHKTQLEVAKELLNLLIHSSAHTKEASKADRNVILENARQLINGGRGARYWLKFCSFFPAFRINRAAAALKLVKETNSTWLAETKNFKAVEKQRTPLQNETLIDYQKRMELLDFATSTNNLEQRDGIIKYKDEYIAAPTYDKKALEKQLKSLQVQSVSSQERSTIKREFEYNEQWYESLLIPMNEQFDELHNVPGVFANIFGKGGISSANRQERGHAINTWLSILKRAGKVHEEGEILFDTFRHAALSDKLEVDQRKRDTNSKKMAEELIVAAFLREISKQGLDLEKAREKGETKPIRLVLGSVSALTPDYFRQIKSSLTGKHDKNEQRMLQDQVKALHSLAGVRTLTINGQKIRVNIEVNTFNFGVNVGARFSAPAAAYQKRINDQAFAQLQKNYTRVMKLVNKEIDELWSQDELSEDQRAKLDALLSKRTSAKELMHDARILLANRASVAKGNNYYEPGTKILNLYNVLDQSVAILNQDRTPQDRVSGYRSAFNCMSGKDRTGSLELAAYSHAVWADQHDGRYPSIEEIRSNPQTRAELLEIYLENLPKGSKDITEINTDVEGFKVGIEARLFGMPEYMFHEVTGFSKLTTS